MRSLRPSAAGGLGRRRGAAAAAMRIAGALAGSYNGNSHLYEAVPSGPAPQAGVDAAAAAALGAFARASPVYERLREEEVGGVRCTVCEGDATGHWLDSLKHDASAAPFYPTWLLSAHCLASAALGLGARSAVDVGSGDGRIAYCCGAAGLPVRSVEIDDGLAAAQRGISERTGVDMGAAGRGEDAFGVDYAGAVRREEGGAVAIFVGALPQVGELLAGAVAGAALDGGREWEAGPLLVLAGVGEEASGGIGGAENRWGWGPLLDGHGLGVLGVLELPTAWTIEAAGGGTPYVFAARASGGRRIRRAKSGGRPDGSCQAPFAAPPAP